MAKFSIARMLNNVVGTVRSSWMGYFGVGISDVIYTNINTDKAIKNGYEGNAAVYSIVSKAAKKFASIPRCLYTQDDKAPDQEIIGTSLNDLLKRPNPFQAQDAFFEALYSFKLLTGEAFIWLNRGDLTDVNGVQKDDATLDKLPVLEMYVLPSNRTFIRPDPLNLWGNLGYVLDVNGKRINLRANDVIHWHGPNLDFDALTRPQSRAMTPLQPGYKTLQQNNDSTDSAVRMYQNDGVKAVIYNETMNNLSPEQISKLKDVVDKKINNNDVKGAVAVLQGKWGALNFGGTSVDMELLKGREMSWKEMCALFDVPYELFQSDTTFANKIEAKKAWVSDHIIPACKQLDDELNRMLLIPFQLDKTAEIKSDFSDLPELQQDLQKTILGLSAAWWLTPNEKRQIMSEEPFDDESFDEPWIPQGFTPLSQASQPLGQPMDNNLNSDYGAGGNSTTGNTNSGL